MKNNKNVFDAIIIGAGAAGLMAACELGEKTQNILILDKMDAPGKKIHATGNGKCNLTNLYMNQGCFRGSCGELAYELSRVLTPEKLRDYFFHMGLLTMERNGYVYPITEQSKTVVQTFLQNLHYKGIPVRTSTKVTSIEQDEKGHFLIRTEQEQYIARNVMVACGGQASPKLGSDGSGYGLLKKMHIRIKKPLPALTGLCSPKKAFKKLSGVRTKGCISYFGKDGHYEREIGEIQLADYGISGIPVFQISRFVIADLDQEKDSKVEVLFDFFPDYTFQELKDIFAFLRAKDGRTCAELLGGLVHEKWVPVLLGESGISPADMPDSVPDKKWIKLITFLKQYPIPINGYRNFEYAQACQGGVIKEEITPELESLRYPGLYILGELVDVDGTCGGYNLHWAFTSGFIAANSIKKRLDDFLE